MKWWASKKNDLPKQTILEDSLKSKDNVETFFFTGSFITDLEQIKLESEHNSDVHYREFRIGQSNKKAAIIYVDGLSNMDLIEKHLMPSLMKNLNEKYQQEDIITEEFIKNNALTMSDVNETDNLDVCMSKVLTGSTALLVEGFKNVMLLATTKESNRSLEEPVSEALIRGPRIGFTESLTENTALLRRHGENKDLAICSFQVGEQIKKKVAISYMKEIADPKLVEEVKRRVKKIKIDYVAESGYIEQLIEDNFLSPFPQVQSTERPDRVICSLLEGRVAILLDGTPFALIAPVTFSMLLQSPEDYYERWIQGSLLRLLRFVAAMVTLFAPALYISFISFHPGLIPSKLAISITGTRAGVPFPSLIEALLLEVAIEILREAGLRLPKPIGPAMGIVGGLIIGEAAVQAGIVSNMMVIIVAITAISSFAIPNYSAGIPLRILRFVAMFFAAIYGLYGVILFFLLLTSHIVKLKSFGVSYASPAVPYSLNDWKDFFVRVPLNMMKRRPKLLHPKDSIRKRS